MAPSKHSAFYVGTSNIELPVRNKAAFPEAFRDASRLHYYGSLFNSLEVNASFYKIPMAKTVERWTAEVPADFRFTFKLNRELTHAKTPLPDPEILNRFMQTINAAESKAGSLLIQFPAGQTHNAPLLERLLVLIGAQNRRWDVCLEFRHDSWYRDSVYRLLETHNAAVVIHDKSQALPRSPESWTAFSYYRFHGPKGDYRNSYEYETLQQHADEIQALLDAGKTVYAYFNNTMGSAVFDALTLQELVTSKITFTP